MKEKLQEEIKTAMKARDQKRVETLRCLLSEVKNVEIDTRAALSEEQFIAVVRKELKKRRDAIEFAQKAARDDLVAENETEIKILEPFLGDQLSEGQLRALIGALIKGGADNIGKVMGALNKEHKGKFDGKTASAIIKELLG